MTDKKPKNYIEPQDFFRETLISLQNDEATDKIAVMFMKLCDKYANHPNFVRYHHIRDDLISVGILACLKGLPKFRPFRNDLIRDEAGEILTSTRVEWGGELVEYDYRTCNNPFAFFTKCAHNEILQMLKAEYNFKNVLNKVRLENGLEADDGYTDMMRDKDEADKLANELTAELFNEDDEEPEESLIEWEN
jgi:hypothetical protein